MSKPIIEIENLGKKYRIGAKRERYLSLRDSIARKSRHTINVLLRKEHIQQKQDDFWALRNISFNINEGEAIGIIGRNGAGKSTLLKILSQITPPSEGKIIMRGRSASLLEVGTGFHPELSGRENIFLNGAILGMTRNEIRRKFDEIVAFAEVNKFLDTPVKRYSSGMYVRLAFAVAAHLEPEILVIDEVLAVGDASFQKKCLGKMGQVASSGRTVLFVSHNMAAIRKLCTKSILIESGTLKAAGETDSVVNNYLSMSQSSSGDDFAKRIRRGLGQHKLINVSLNSRKSDIILAGDPLSIHFTFNSNIKMFRFIFTIYNAHGVMVSYYDTYTRTDNDSIGVSPNTLVCHIGRLLLVPGRYFINTSLSCSGELQDHVHSATSFQVLDNIVDGRMVNTDMQGMVALPHAWKSN